MSKQKQFSGQKSYKMRESTLYCIGNSERNMDLSVIYLAVVHTMKFFNRVSNFYPVQLAAKIED